MGETTFDHPCGCGRRVFRVRLLRESTGDLLVRGARGEKPQRIPDSQEGDLTVSHLFFALSSQVPITDLHQFLASCPDCARTNLILSSLTQEAWEAL